MVIRRLGQLERQRASCNMDVEHEGAETDKWMCRSCGDKAEVRWSDGSGRVGLITAQGG